MAARELAMAGKELVIIEQGSAMSRFAGLDEMGLGKQLYQDNGKFPRTEEGYSILRRFNLGGTTEAAASLNLGISKWPKFIDFDKCNHCGL